MSSKKKKNAIHWITRVSVVGITVTTAALVILLSAFNGIEEMVEKLYSDFDPDITIRSAKGKTFFENQIDFNAIQSMPGIETIAQGIEEVVVLKHENKWVNAKLIGVEDNFLKISKMSQHMVDGLPLLKEEGEELVLVGATLLDKLEGFIPSMNYETLIIYSPKRDMKMKLGRNPFETQLVKVSGRINYNREVNSECIVAPIEVARKLLDFKKESTVVFADVNDSRDVNEVKEALQEKLGRDFVVKTNYEKNELIYKTSQSEKIIVIIILLFIFVIAAFTLVAALTMLYIEKKDNLGTLYALGADKSFVFRIFFLEGLMISFKGIVFGLLLGYGVCLVQIYGQLLVMPNSAGEPFPMQITFGDGLMIFTMVSVLSILASYLPAKFLRRNE
ncbi:MAG: FtsX-like permease family protein [Crocinitomicaceae bacterium]